MYQGAIAAFKAYYLRERFVQAVAVSKSIRTLHEHWKAYNIHNAFKNIAVTRKEVMELSMNGTWKSFWKQWKQQQ